MLWVCAAEQGWVLQAGSAASACIYSEFRAWVCSCCCMALLLYGAAAVWRCCWVLLLLLLGTEVCKIRSG